MSAADYLATLKSKLYGALSEQGRLTEELTSQQQVLGRMQSKLKYKEKQLNDLKQELEESKTSMQRAEMRLAETESEVNKKRQVLLNVSQLLRDKEFDLDSKQQTLAEERHTLCKEQLRRSNQNDAKDIEIAGLKTDVKQMKDEIRALDLLLEAKLQERAQAHKNFEAAQTAYDRNAELNAERLENLEHELDQVKEAIRTKKRSVFKRSEEFDCVAEREQTSWHEEISFAMEEKPSLFDDLVKRMALLEEKLSKSLNKGAL